jgi:Mg2+ and Co2+ transporter CorA
MSTLAPREQYFVLMHICSRLKVAGDLSKSLEKLNGQFEPQEEIIHLLHSIRGELQKAKSRPPSYGDQDSRMFPMSGDIVPANTIQSASDFVKKVSSRRQELQKLQTSAREVAEQLHDLMTLKQQQASIIEATAALGLAEETVKQGRTIMGFTVITIIFLPLSFMSSVFGMNAKELSGSAGGVMSLKAQFQLMCMFSSPRVTYYSHTNPTYSSNLCISNCHFPDRRFRK